MYNEEKDRYRPRDRDRSSERRFDSQKEEKLYTPGWVRQLRVNPIILKKLNPFQRITIPHLNHSFSMKRWYSGTRVWESSLAIITYW